MLSLKTETDAAWVEEAMRDLDRVLVDHAHCEMKAASNALSLAARHPEIARGRPRPDGARARGDRPLPARAHAARTRAGSRSAPRRSTSTRRRFAVRRRRSGAGRSSGRSSIACSSARSSRRARASGSSSWPRRSSERAISEMSAFYTELLAAEARHYREFVDLAAIAAGGERGGATRDRRARAARRPFAEREGAIVQHSGALQRRRARYHSRVGAMNLPDRATSLALDRDVGRRAHAAWVKWKRGARDRSRGSANQDEGPLDRFAARRGQSTYETLGESRAGGRGDPAPRSSPPVGLRVHAGAHRPAARRGAREGRGRDERARDASRSHTS